MFNFFHTEGKASVLIERLQILVRDWEICIAVSSSILAEIPSETLYSFCNIKEHQKFTDFYICTQDVIVIRAFSSKSG